MLIALNGASGFTGRLAAAELSRRGIDAVLVGRDPGRLRAAAAGTDFGIRIAEIGDPDALAAAFAGADAVINTAGPFARLGGPVIRAAVAARAGCWPRRRRSTRSRSWASCPGTACAGG
jgi:short subunit dehydrogenase-like uncharacterized protein